MNPLPAPRVLRRGLPALLAVIFVLVAPPGRAAPVILPDGSFYEEISVLGEHWFSDNTRPETVAMSQSFGPSGGRGSATGSAWTTAGVLPTASIDLTLVGTGGSVNGRAIAMIGYFWTVEQIAGAPYFSEVPVNVTTHGSVSRQSVGPVVAGGELYARAGFDWLGSLSTFEADLCEPFPCLDGSESFDRTFRKFVGIGPSYFVGLTVWGHLEAGAGGTVHLAGDVDPDIEIDPEFARAADFRLRFSAGIGPAPVPLPLPALLLSAALRVLAGCRGRGPRAIPG